MVNKQKSTKNQVVLKNIGIFWNLLRIFSWLSKVNKRFIEKNTLKFGLPNFISIQNVNRKIKLRTSLECCWQHWIQYKKLPIPLSLFEPRECELHDPRVQGKKLMFSADWVLLLNELCGYLYHSTCRKKYLKSWNNGD